MKKLFSLLRKVSFVFIFMLLVNVTYGDFTGFQFKPGSENKRFELSKYTQEALTNTYGEEIALLKGKDWIKTHNIVTNGTQYKSGKDEVFIGPYISSGRFLGKNSSGGTLDNGFYHGGMYRSNVGGDNYSLINSFYLSSLTTGNKRVYVKSFLDINKDYLSTTGQDGLLTYLAKRDLSVRWLGFEFFTEKDLDSLGIQSMKEINVAIDEYFQDATNKENFYKMINGFQVGSRNKIKVVVNGQDVNLIVGVFQKNPYWKIDEFKDVKNKYNEGNYIYKSNSQGRCGTYNFDVKGDGKKMINLYDYHSFILNCGFNKSHINDTREYNYNRTFSTYFDAGASAKGVYGLTLLNIHQIETGLSSYSNQTIDEGFGINYGIYVDGGKSELIDSFRGSFSKEVLKGVKSFDFSGNRLFGDFLSSFSDIGKVIEHEKSENKYDTLINKKVGSVLEEGNMYGHYRNIKKLDSVAIEEDSFSKILGLDKVKILEEKYEYSIFNGKRVLYETLGDSGLGKEVDKNRTYDIFDKSVTENCKNNGSTTMRNKCISRYFLNFDRNLDKLMQFNDSGYIDGIENNNKFHHSSTQLNVLTGINGKFFQTNTWNGNDEGFVNGNKSGSVGADYIKNYVGMGSKSGVEKSVLLKSNGKLFGALGDFTYKTDGTYFGGHKVSNNKYIDNENVKKHLKNGKSNFKYSDLEYKLPFGNTIIQGSTNYSNVTGGTIGVLSNSNNLPVGAKGDIYRGFNNGKIYTGKEKIENFLTFIKEGIGEFPVKNQNSYGLYQLGSEGYYGNGVLIEMNESGKNIDEKGLLFGFNGPGLLYSKDKNLITKTVYPSHYAEGKLYETSYYLQEKLEQENGSQPTSIFSGGKVKGDSYTISYGKDVITSARDGSTKRDTYKKATGKLNGNLKNAVIHNMFINLYSGKYGLNVGGLLFDLQKQAVVDIYTSEKSDGELSVVFKVVDIDNNIWLLPTKYYTNGKISYFGKIKEEYIGDEQKALLSSGGSSLNISFNLANKLDGNKIVTGKTESISDFKKFDEISFNTYHVYSDTVFYKEIKEGKRGNFFKLNGNITEFYDDIGFNKTSFFDDSFENDSDDYSGMGKFYEGVVYDYIESVDFNGDSLNMIVLTNQFTGKGQKYLFDGKNPYTVEDDPTEEMIKEGKLKGKETIPGNLMLVSFIDERPSFITVFNNKKYTGMPENEKIVSSIVGEGGLILEATDNSFKLNTGILNLIKENISDENIPSTNTYNVLYKLKGEGLSSAGGNLIGKRKFEYKIIPNFPNIVEGNIKLVGDEEILKFIKTTVTCGGKTGSGGNDITFKNVNMRNGKTMKDCKVTFEVDVTKNSLLKLTGRSFKMETTLKTRIVDEEGKVKTEEVGTKENMFVFNDITMLGSLPYDQISNIPNCRVVVKTQDSAGTQNVHTGSGISGKYDTVEIDVIYKNPDISNNGSLSKQLKGVAIDLLIAGNGKFENYGSEYYSLLNGSFEKDKDKMGNVSKEIFDEIKKGTIYQDKKIRFFVGGSHFKKNRFFGKTTFYIKPTSRNLNKFDFSLSGKCEFSYIGSPDVVKPLQGGFNFKHSKMKSDDFSTLTYYNVEGKDKTLFSTGFSKQIFDGNNYLVKQYSPSILTLSYIHNGNADGLDSTKRIDKNLNGEFNGITTGITRADQGWHLSTINNSPAEGTKGSGTNMQGYGYSLIDTLRSTRQINSNQTSFSEDNGYGSTSWRRATTEVTWETTNNIFELANGGRQGSCRDGEYSRRCNKRDCRDKNVDAKPETFRTKNMAQESWKNGIDGKTGQAFGGYYNLRFDGFFTVGLKEIGKTNSERVVDRIVPFCMGNSFNVGYKAKAFKMGIQDTTLVVDTLSQLQQRFLGSSNSMITSNSRPDSGCKLESGKQIEIIESKEQENTYKLKADQKAITKEIGFPFFYKHSGKFESRLPEDEDEIKNTFGGNIKVDDKGIIKLFVTPELKKEIEKATLYLKINPNDLSSSNNTGKVKVNFNLVFDLKYKDKKRPNDVKNNELYKLLDKGNSEKVLFDLQFPMLSVSSFNESYSHNESTLINKIMVGGDDNTTKEVVKTSADDNLLIQGKYKKFVVSEHRTGKNTWKVTHRENYRSGNRSGYRKHTCSISNIGTYSSGKITPYFGGLNRTEFKLKNNETKSNSINTFHQYTDSLGDQIANKTLMINGVPSVKGIGGNQVIYEGLCNVCGSLQGNIFETKSVGMFNSKSVLGKTGTTNIFKYYQDPRNFKILTSTLGDSALHGGTGAKNFQINAIISPDRNGGQPYVEKIIAKNTQAVEITPQGLGEMKGLTLYEGKKAVLVKGVSEKEKAPDLIISSDILPKNYNNFVTAGKKIEDDLVIVADGDIIIGPDVSIINAVLITKGNLFILPGNNSLKLHGGVIVQGKLFNYRINVNDINTKDFGNNYKTGTKNVELFNLKYPVLLTIDQRYLNSKIFNFIETVFRTNTRN